MWSSISCAYISRPIISKRIKWANHAAGMKEIRNMYKILTLIVNGRAYLEDLIIDGRLLLNWILKL
jgi:hypothetical protein